MNWLLCWFKTTGHNIERSDYVIHESQPLRWVLRCWGTIGIFAFNLSTCLRCGQQWHETIVEKAEGVAV